LKLNNETFLDACGIQKECFDIAEKHWVFIDDGLQQLEVEGWERIELEVH